jgi:hypothetical protein
MWFGQFRFQSNSYTNPDSNANAGNYTIADSSSNARAITNSYADARAIECFHHWPSG